MAKELYDYSDLTGGNALDLLGHLIRWGMAGKKLRTVQFTAQALTDGIEVGELKSVFGSAQDRIMFKARIVAPDPPQQPPDPCDPAYFNDTDYVYKLISMHPWFVSIKDTSITSPVTRGDLILVELEARGNRTNPRFNMKYGRFIKLLSVEDPSPKETERCAVLIKMFGEISHEPLSVKKMDISGDSFLGSRVKGIRRRTINFSTIQFKPNPVCKPGDKTAGMGKNPDVKKYFGKDKWEQYKRSLSKRESGSESGDYKSKNKWWYSGRYQFGIEAMAGNGVLKKEAYQTMVDAGCKGQGDGCEALAKKVLENDANWSGVSSWAEWDANKGDIQEKAFYSYTNRNFRWLVKAGLVDLDSPQDVAGMLAGRHLRGYAVQEMRKTGKEISDRNGTFPSHYYAEIGGEQC
tara:strand:+ start:25895 stop:27112 length:1218 start_codon:yes stop_codon:yes gene_type:complete